MSHRLSLLVALLAAATAAAQEAVELTAVAQGERCGRRAAGRLVLRSAEQLAEAGLALPAGSTVVWERESLLLALMGEQPGRGYTITILSARRQAEGGRARWSVRVEERRPAGPGEAGEASTAFHLVRVPRVAPEDEVEWLAGTSPQVVVRQEAAPAPARDPVVIVEDAAGEDAVGSGRSGAYGQRWGKGSLAREGGTPETEAAVTAALRWLAAHQAPGGRWDSAGWANACGRGKGLAPCAGPGTAQGDARYDVGQTSLALLAFLGNGHTHRSGAHKRVVERGLQWLKQQQGEDGCLGYDDALGQTIYNHALATQALCEAYAVSRDVTVKRYAEKALEWSLAAQNPRLGWKYGIKSGRNDTSVTTLMLQALVAARAAGLEVPEEAFEGGRQWLIRATDARGDVGYETPGGGSAFLGPNDGKFDPLPCMTAAAVFTRRHMGETVAGEPLLAKGGALLAGSPPAWEARKLNFYYWNCGTNATFQLGGEGWTTWNQALTKALLPHQRFGGCEDGSWDPVDEWSLAGGRVYATALNALTLEVYYRFERAR